MSVPLLSTLKSKTLGKLIRTKQKIAATLFPSPVKYCTPYPAERLKAATRPEKLLFVCFFDPNGINTVAENVKLWCGLSEFNFDIINLFEGQFPAGLELGPNVDIRKYDGIVIHCTVAYNVSNLISLDRHSKQKIAEYEGIKVLMKQDEHYKTTLTADYIGSRRFDAVITLTTAREVHRMYPRQRVGNAEFVHVYTGYVSDHLQKLRYPKTDQRAIDIGYRGSLQPLAFGMLAWEKRQIGDLFIPVCKKHGFTYDISSRWEDRFTGSAWFDFLGRIKGVLGVESGASIVDFEGNVEKEVAEFQKGNPSASFDEIWNSVLKKYEENAYYKAISPRHLEAAATKTVQIMYEGDFNGIFVPDRHFISLKRDLSNIDDVVARFKDPAERERLTEAAYEEIIMNEKYHYRSYVKTVDEFLLKKFDS